MLVLSAGATCWRNHNTCCCVIGDRQIATHAAHESRQAQHRSQHQRRCQSHCKQEKTAQERKARQHGQSDCSARLSHRSATPQMHCRHASIVPHHPSKEREVVKIHISLVRAHLRAVATANRAIKPRRNRALVAAIVDWWCICPISTLFA
jgi:hypothetical protein